MCISGGILALLIVVKGAVSEPGCLGLNSSNATYTGQGIYVNGDNCTFLRLLQKN